MAEKQVEIKEAHTGKQPDTPVVSHGLSDEETAYVAPKASDDRSVPEDPEVSLGLTDADVLVPEEPEPATGLQRSEAEEQESVQVASGREVGEVEEIDLEQEAAELTEEELRVQDNIRKRRRRRRRPSPLKVALFTIVVIVATLIFMGSGFFTIDSIRVEGNSYFSDDEIINMGHATTGKNLFYHSGSRDIIKYLEESPYIDSAKVSKKMPGTLVIKVKERAQVAALVYNKEYLIIDRDGMLLRRSKTKPKLTIINGVTVSKIELSEKLGAKDKDRFEDALQIIRVMNQGDMYFKKLNMADGSVSAYVYDALVCKAKTDELVDAIDKGRLQKILKTLFDKNIKRGTITLSKDGYASFEPTV